MTHEQKIEILSNEIRKALPYLNQVEQPVKLVQASQNGNSIESIQVSNCICVQLEPMLNDVLAWLMKLEFKYFEDTVYLSHTLWQCGFTSESISFYYPWNLEKQYLKDQSEQLINFLYSLIEQK